MFYCGLLGSTCMIQSLGLRGGTGCIFVFVWILMNEPGIRICSLASKMRAFRFVSSPFLPALIHTPCLFPKGVRNIGRTEENFCIDGKESDFTSQNGQGLPHPDSAEDTGDPIVFTQWRRVLERIQILILTFWFRKEC